eukprot:UN09916
MKTTAVKPEEEADKLDFMFLTVNSGLVPDGASRRGRYHISISKFN